MILYYRTYYVFTTFAIHFAGIAMSLRKVFTHR